MLRPPTKSTLFPYTTLFRSIMHKLVKIAEIYNVAIIVTNQVQSTPDTFFGDPTKPAGGNVIGHASTYRIYLREAGNEDRKSTRLNSSHGYISYAVFCLKKKK